MCKFDGILKWEGWEAKHRWEVKLGLRNTKTRWVNVKKNTPIQKRGFLEN